MADVNDETEHQQVVIALMNENEQLSSSNEVKSKVKKRRPKKNYCTEDYLVGYGVPIFVIILVITGIVLAIFVMRRYNQNCKRTEGASCRGLRWLFT